MLTRAGVQVPFLMAKAHGLRWGEAVRELIDKALDTRQD